MPVVDYTSINNNAILIVWHITEPIDFFTSQFSDLITDESAPAVDSLQWWASRACILHHFPQGIRILKNGDNKPRLLVSGVFYEVSISHSFEYAAILISPDKKVGIDVEKTDQRINRVKHKFCSDAELETAQDDTEKLTLIWSAKEALYKLYSKKEVIFNKHLAVDLSSQPITGQISMPSYKMSLPVHVRIYDEYLLTWVMED
jgi:phosphopantetheinyl transferase (holo-ACP synthase)